MSDDGYRISALPKNTDSRGSVYKIASPLGSPRFILATRDAKGRYNLSSLRYINPEFKTATELLSQKDRDVLANYFRGAGIPFIQSEYQARLDAVRNPLLSPEPDL